MLINETIDGVPVAQEVKEEKNLQSSKQKTAVRQKADTYIWGIYIMLLVISVIELFSASSTEISGHNVYTPLIRHGVFLLLGLGIVIVFQRTRYVVFARCAWPFAVFSLGLLLISNFFGVEINGAQRAISVAGFTIQPAEIVKLSVVILLATILGRNQKLGGIKFKGSALAAGVVVVFAGLLWKNGLTNTILLFVVSVSMFLIGGMKWKEFWMIMLIYGLSAGVLYKLRYDDKDSEFDRVSTGMVASNTEDRSDTHKNRLQRYLEGVSPNDKMTDYNRQEMLAKMAQANGGILGQGPGNSRESARLPLAFSDYIYSIIVEDTGLVGGLFLLILYLGLLARAGRITLKLKRALPAFMIMGCAVLIVFQALVHMAIVTGLGPVSGQPLPFISKGGTSVLVMSAAIGIMLSVSRFAVKRNPDGEDNKHAEKEELRSLPKDLRAANYSDTDRS